MNKTFKFDKKTFEIKDLLETLVATDGRELIIFLFHLSLQRTSLLHRGVTDESVLVSYRDLVM